MRMNWKKARFDLAQIKICVAHHRHRCFTEVAMEGIVTMNLTTTEALSVIASAKKSHFFKSMPSYDDVGEWMDVYHIPYGNHGDVAYVKFILRPLPTSSPEDPGPKAPIVVISFKYKDEDQ